MREAEKIRIDVTKGYKKGQNTEEKYYLSVEIGMIGVDYYLFVKNEGYQTKERLLEDAASKISEQALKYGIRKPILSVFSTEKKGRRKLSQKELDEIKNSLEERLGN